MKTLIRSTICILALTSVSAQAQIYDDYVGAGHNQGITVSTSSDHTRFGWEENATGDKTLDGSGLDARYMEASRFLSQAALGGGREDIEEVLALGFEGWIDAQFELASPSYIERVDQILDEQLQVWIDNNGSAEEFQGPFWQHFQNTWWQTNLTNEDYLRQRIALALSEIFVVSYNSNIEEHAYAPFAYYDVLLDNSFGNFEEMLAEITYHPTMGVYLSHYNNPKAIPAANIHPDENYAREIMQLFTIGLYELNNDGTEVLDGEGNPIPTYDNEDIGEMAKVFTGLGPSATVPYNDMPITPDFGVSRYLCDFTEPMAMYQEWHSTGSKFLPDGTLIPSGQTGDEDIADAISWLVNHNNTGPFIARRLIQRLVKSNPTPDYVSRVVDAFADNGAGERGDMKAVIKAVLLDEEARTCDWIQDPIQGKLRESMVAAMHFCRANNVVQEQGYYWNTSYEIYELTGLAPLSSPTVFNFFLPDFQPNGDIQDMGLVGPEFQTHNSRTSIGYLNMVDSYSNGYQVWYAWQDIAENYLDIDEYLELAREPEVYLNELDVLFTHGQMSDETRENFVNTLNEINPNYFGDDYLIYRVYLGLYLTMISPDYTILK